MKSALVEKEGTIQSLQSSRVKLGDSGVFLWKSQVGTPVSSTSACEWHGHRLIRADHAHGEDIRRVEGGAWAC